MTLSPVFQVANARGTRSAPHLASRDVGCATGSRRRGKVVCLGRTYAFAAGIVCGICDVSSATPISRSGREAIANCDPHGQPARGTLISTIKLVYLLVANWLGYLVVGAAAACSRQAGPVRPLLPRLPDRSEAISSPCIVPANCRSDLQASSSGRFVCGARCSRERAAAT